MELSNNTIAKNTILLYVRLILTMVVGLYTARVVLRTLGVSDYGLYEVVGGFISLFTIVNTVLASGTSRFITIAIGKGDLDELKMTFSTSFWLHIAFAIIFVVIIESFGLWFFFEKMNIPAGREYAAQWVFHLSVLATATSIIQVPFNSTLIAHEKMDIYAYISIYDVCMKLLIVYLLTISRLDKLVLYASLLCLVNITDIIIYQLYCRYKYEECRFLKLFNSGLVKKMLNFSIWNIFGNAALVGSGQGVNMIINVFYGTSVNAARGIANKVNGIVMQFVSSFLLAVNPQITKSYASGDINRMFDLSKNACKFGTMMMLLIGMPLIMEMDIILKLWLGEVPEHSVFFSRITLLQSFVMAMSRPMITILQATGRIKWTSLTVGLMLLSIVPLTYYLLDIGVSIDVVYIINVIPWVLEVVAYMWFIKRYTGVHTSEYLTDVLYVIIVVCIVGTIPGYLLHIIIQSEIARLLIVVPVTFLSLLLSVAFIGLNKGQRTKIITYMLNKIRK